MDFSFGTNQERFQLSRAEGVVTLLVVSRKMRRKKSKSLYRGHRFPAGVINCAVRWYYRYQLSLRDIEELLFERGVIVTYETIRCWCDKFGAAFARRVKAARRKPGGTWHVDEMFVTLRGNLTCYGAQWTSTAPNS